MTLLHDICRCLGEKPAGTCDRRQQCQRYLERDTFGPRTPFTSWLCGPEDYDHIIRHEKTIKIQAAASHS